jgi:hypothetical protein
MLTLKQRSIAVFNCIYFGVVPSYVYEKKCHYSGSFTYLGHLKHNTKVAFRLITFKEPLKYHNFFKAKAKYFRWQ